MGYMLLGKNDKIMEHIQAHMIYLKNGLYEDHVWVNGLVYKTINQL